MTEEERLKRIEGILNLVLAATNRTEEKLDAILEEASAEEEMESLGSRFSRFCEAGGKGH